MSLFYLTYIEGHNVKINVKYLIKGSEKVLLIVSHKSKLRINQHLLVIICNIEI